MRMSESNMGSLLVLTIQPLEEGRVVGLNIGHDFALQQFQCCDAAKYNLHGFGKE
jgi:hypothetical protein